MTWTQVQPYIRPSRFDRLMRLYDRIIPRLLPEVALKHRLIEQACIRPGARVLDLKKPDANKHRRRAVAITALFGGVKSGKHWRDDSWK